MQSAKLMPKSLKFHCIKGYSHLFHSGFIVFKFIHNYFTQVSLCSTLFTPISLGFHRIEIYWRLFHSGFIVLKFIDAYFTQISLY